MRFIMTIIWALLIGGVLSYVLTSMAGEPFNLNQSIILSSIIAVLIFILSGVLKDSSQEQ
ncbi:cytochrome c oxidase subunit IV [Cerasibacillus quisquiliarum]|uniref:DUF2929 domain-containing protein n=1 Tax=Cerasibacillus quisquiliarum TaxID=227865 RepID=A0A511UVS7_9BACI|nr:DUF2929 family protein [Cerasibacillus quisquiliarum]MBB5146360.1 cytochrome c oxidase subunit IV [Cerasibacillus quisquiliarum]GEN30687.1 hypothetical protein CQU01_09250 [Cerasibacillus quisquiliarum]